MRVSQLLYMGYARATHVTPLIQGSRLILNLRAVAREHVWESNNLLELNALHTELALSGNGVVPHNTTTIDESPMLGRESGTTSADP
jgi:hypothetical protein